MRCQGFVEHGGGDTRLESAGEVAGLDVQNGVELGERKPERGGGIRIVAGDPGAIPARLKGMAISTGQYEVEEEKPTEEQMGFP